MTNEQRQKQLDEQKWLFSEAKKKDCSGEMDWCIYCKYQTDGKCVSQQSNVKYPCATAYNRMRRNK